MISDVSDSADMIIAFHVASSYGVGAIRPMNRSLMSTVSAKHSDTTAWWATLKSST
jgi:hypothetical protein